MTTLPAEKPYFTTRELRDAGVSANQLTRLVRAGTLHRVVSGLYSTRPSRREHLLRALLHQRPDLVFPGCGLADKSAPR
ncbi:type IV toxin-antitoxin system AbiEi family antitoxin domain-containing protein [Corynebacterium nasicanis]|uniref:Type IV toxin-antitoxin system AbiEi family antitoxin domain-containing protein n=1 Tax=Corynebacterium nasicanis TaxID=1448267 RepID=A0ABW1QB42_9CORY